MTSHLSHVMTLANGIIGVSVLAMPFCFKQCGIILAAVVLLTSCVLSRLACHFLVKSAVMSRRRNFELLAFHAFGRMGKFTVELFIIGFLIGTCVAFFVVVGDLGPQIIGKLIDRNPEDIRTSLLVTTGAFIVLPLGLLRNIDSLSAICTATIGFYFCLVLKVIGESTRHIFTGDWYNHVYYWRPAGILQCLPIFSMALFCQTQLFAIYETIPNVSLEKMNQVVRGALNICTLVYLCVGFFGYVAFCTQSFSGNILMSLEPNLSSEMIKMGFVFSVAFSFPLVIFPCRASLNSLLFRRVHTHEPPNNTYMPETRFRCLTFTIVCISLIIGISIPNIEFVLGLVGSTIGVMICLIFPAAFFVSISSKNTNERLVAQAILFIGVWIMVLGTYANLYAMEESSSDSKIALPTNAPFVPINNLPMNVIEDNVPNIAMNPKIISNVKEKMNPIPDKILEKSLDPEDIRREPPVPVERIVVTEKPIAVTPESIGIVALTIATNVKTAIERTKTTDEGPKRDSGVAPRVVTESSPITEDEEMVAIPRTKPDMEIIGRKKNLVELQKVDNLVNADAIRKEETELASSDNREIPDKLAAERHEELRKTLEKHKLEQLRMMAEQKELLKDIKEQTEELEKTKRKITKNKAEYKKDMQSRNNEYHAPEPTDDALIANANISDKDGAIKLDDNKDHDTFDVKNDRKFQRNTADGDANQDARNNPVFRVREIAEKNGKGNDPERLKGSILNALTKNASKASVVRGGGESPGTQRDTEDKGEHPARSAKLQRSSNVDRPQAPYRMPIALTLRNHSKITQPQLSSRNEITVENVQLIGRDILENHEREKREIDEAKRGYDTKISKNLMTERMQRFVKDIAVNDEKVECQREEDESRKNKDLFKEERRSSDASSTRTSLIKTNFYLFDQELTDRVFVDGSIIRGADYPKIQKRDLKSMRTNGHTV